jgi:hypothetical protein
MYLDGFDVVSEQVCEPVCQHTLAAASRADDAEVFDRVRNHHLSLKAVGSCKKIHFFWNFGNFNRRNSRLKFRQI